MNSNETVISGEAVDSTVAKNGYSRITKRLFDVFFSALGLILLAPIGALIALLIKLGDWGPVFYRQRRVGLHGKLFEILKFRTMVVNADQRGPSVTWEKDPRITFIGRILRRSKLDELPQLWNVLVGTMSFVGPRPEVPRYVDRYTPEQRQILNFKPGITDLATLVFRDEETLLHGAADVEEFYVKHCIPRKFSLNLQYAQRANLMEDILIIYETLCPYWLSIFSTYIFAQAFSLWLAYQLRYDFDVPPQEMIAMERMGLIIIPIQLVCLMWRRQIVGLLSYFDLPEIKQLFFSLSLAALIQLFIWFITNGMFMPARSIIVMDFIIAMMVIGGTRMILRLLRETQSDRNRRSEKTEVLRVGIIGAGELGTWLAHELNFRKKGNRRIEAFFDDDPDKWNRQLHGVPVVGMPECILQGAWAGKLDEVIVPMPGASSARLKQIKSILGSSNIRSRTMPSLDEILS